MESYFGTVVRRWHGPNAGQYAIRVGELECVGHYSDILTEAFRHLEVGDRVRCRIEKTEQGPVAKYIYRLPDDDEEWLDGH